MRQIDYFVPGGTAEGQDDEFLPRLRSPIPPAVIETYVGAYTQPGDVVLLPFGQSAAEVRMVLRLGRRPVAVHYDPLLVLLMQAGLYPVPARELDAAVTRLGDSPKQGTPLHRYIESLYATSCPACLRPAVADYFIWEQGLPVAKHLHCPECEFEGQAGIERADLQPLADIPPQGLHYHYLLDRVAPQPQSNALRGRLEPLLELYTSRSLAALTDVTRKMEALPAGPTEQRAPGTSPVRRALQVALLICLDRCSALGRLPADDERRRGPARPARFIEHNVWRAFEEAVCRVRAWADLPAVPAGLASGPLAGRPDGHGFVGQASVRDLLPALDAKSLPLILVSPPPLDVTAWSLSYLWGAWLLGTEAVAPLRSLLRSRTPDPAWYARVMAGSFRTLADLLSADGHLLVVLEGQRPALLEALSWATARAGLRATTLLQSGDNYRVELAPAPQAASDGQANEGAIQRLAREAAVDALRARGEPTPAPTLHAAVERRLSESGVLGQLAGHGGPDAPGPDAVAAQAQAAWQGRGLVRVEDGDEDADLWWLARPGRVEPPLADRVEATVQQALQEQDEVDEAGFTGQIYARFPGVLTPGPEMIGACLRSYANPGGPGRWRLRPEDQAETRRQERLEIIEHLLRLGKRLGYEARAASPFDAGWFKEGRARAFFVVRWQAAIGEALALGGRLRGARPYLVIPGGRAALASFKLARNPLWQEALDRAGWRFIKYRHVRHLAAEPEVDEYSLRVVVGLDPIVEREAVQIPLF